MTIEQWQIHPDLKEELDSHYNTSYALSLKDHDALSIARALTFDSLSDTITEGDIEKFLHRINRSFVKGKLRGVGLEIGSGPGTFIASIATLNEVTRIYGVEACEPLVRELSPKVVNAISGDNSHKVVSAVGDFNALQMHDNTVDFIFDFFSLHHSSSPQITLQELARVLKPGGVMVCIDKARANSMSEKQLDQLLDIEYSAKTKMDMGLPPDKFLDRRMNGEHEYRLKDWNKYFTEVGFSEIEHYNVAKIGGNPMVCVVKRCLAHFPAKLQAQISPFISKRITNNLEPSNRIFTNIFPQYPREFSLMIAYKR